MSVEWITGSAARRILGVGYSSLQRLCVLGRVRTRLDPGVPVRYHRGDVEAVASFESSSPSVLKSLGDAPDSTLSSP
jgi:hypothetical protein